jgi:hypothetical protein
MSDEEDAYPAHALDGGIPLQPNSELPCPAASDVRRSAILALL